MPWYWTDEVAAILVANGSIDADVAATLIRLPIAHRSAEVTIEAAAQTLLDEGEIPLAA
jgi:hypothetical protein